jgi:predicted PurR-regulated permease PerM
VIAGIGSSPDAENTMSTAHNGPPRENAEIRKPAPWPVMLRKLTIWALFFLILYLARDFFFTAFMTFMFSYVVLALAGWGMKRLTRGQERPGLWRLLVLATFVLLPLALAGVGFLLAPRLVDQGRRMAGWLSKVNPEQEVAHLLEELIAPGEFRRQYGGPDDPRYRKALEEFRQSGETHVAEYTQFPRLEAWVDGAFSKHFADAESGRIRSRLLSEGTSSKAFENWFVKEKVPQLLSRARPPTSGKDEPSLADSHASATTSPTPEQLLQQVRRDPARLEALRTEWFDYELKRDLAAAQTSPAYHEQMRRHYEKWQEENPQSLPYTFEQYVELQKAWPQGRVAFGNTLENILPSSQGEGDAQLQADFEAAKKHELFQEWWGTNSTARFIRHQVESNVSGGGEGRVDRALHTLLNLPLDLGTALVLSFFICIDFPALRRAFPRLRETWLRDVFEDLAQPLSSLARLMGRAMQAQALIALCNALLTFLALTVLGVEHAVLLALAVFILCQVPTLGMCISWALLMAMALLQPGGGLMLALKLTGAVVVIVLLETFVFSPRILGRMMELHPVLLLAVLPLAQYFFGIWGLILATPIAVYVVHVLILGRGLPGIEEPGDAGNKVPAGVEESETAQVAAVAKGRSP